jgi:outer membrane protein assembly factor BamB
MPSLSDFSSRTALWTALTVAVFAGTARTQDVKTLRGKWEHVLQKRVELTTPSHWNEQLPWVVSTPAIADLGGAGPELEVVTGTEEGQQHWYPVGHGNGRYIALTHAGAQLWEYKTDNNAGRASPAIADVATRGGPEIFGGSTSGWMTHAIGADGARLWRFESPTRANMMAPPAIGDVHPDLGHEIVAMDHQGAVYCLNTSGKLLWRADPPYPSTYVASAPAIADLTQDGRAEVVVSVGGGVAALRGSDGALLWRARGKNIEMDSGMQYGNKLRAGALGVSSPAVLSMPTG